MGAWIETRSNHLENVVAVVAPYVGAWIETCVMKNLLLSIVSHPTWVRGLKHGKGRLVTEYQNVAPYVGAWIETSHIFGE